MTIKISIEDTFASEVCMTEAGRKAYMIDLTTLRMRRSLPVPRSARAYITTETTARQSITLRSTAGDRGVHIGEGDAVLHLF